MNEKPVGIFDSGIGGLTVLPHAVKLLPGQKFIYFGDTANAPYGIKDCDTIIDLTQRAAEFLIKKGIKALLIACNTATSAAIQHLRNTLSMPVIGMEPALKLAVDKGGGGTVAVMATPFTIREKKFHLLLDNFSSKAEVIPMPCPGLVEIIEKGEWEGAAVNTYLKQKFADISIEKITDVVLGCTHYIFIKDAIVSFFGNKVNVLDGNEGTAKQLKKILINENLYEEDMQFSGFDDSMIEYYFSGNKDKQMRRYKNWLENKIKKN